MELTPHNRNLQKDGTHGHTREVDPRHPPHLKDPRYTIRTHRTPTRSYIFLTQRPPPHATPVRVKAPRHTEGKRSTLRKPQTSKTRRKHEKKVDTTNWLDYTTLYVHMDGSGKTLPFWRGENEPRRWPHQPHQRPRLPPGNDVCTKIVAGKG